MFAYEHDGRVTVDQPDFIAVDSPDGLYAVVYDPDCGVWVAADRAQPGCPELGRFASADEAIFALIGGPA